MEEMPINSKSLKYYDNGNFKTLVPQMVATVIAAFFSILNGISMGYSAILIPQLMDTQNGTNVDIPITKSESSWFASCFPIVVPIGSIIGGYFMDTLGRLNLLRLVAVPSALGWMLIAISSNFAMIICGRVLTGFVSFCGVSCGLVYITEISRVDLRGAFMSVVTIFVSMGAMLVYIKGWFLNWRAIAWICMGYSLLTIPLTLIIPESPSWLISKGRDSEAEKSLKWFYKYQPMLNHESKTYAEMQLLVLQKEQEKRQRGQSNERKNNFFKMARMFLLPTAYKPLLILSGLFLFQQFTGVFIILFHGVLFFKDIGTGVDPYLAMIYLGIIRVVMSVVSVWLMAKFGRRSLCIVSCVGMAVSIGFSGLYTKWIHDGTAFHIWIPVLTVLLFIAFSMVGITPIPFITSPEMFPLEIRGLANNAVFIVANLITFTAVQSYYTLIEVFGGTAGIQFFFAAISVVAILFILMFLPETHNKSLLEIEEYFWHHNIYFSTKSSKKTSRSKSINNDDGLK